MEELKIRLWGKRPGNNFLTPASFMVGLDEPDLFIRSLNDLQHGWILSYYHTNPNKLKPEELIEMAKEIIDHNGVQLLLVGQDKAGNKIWLSQNFAEYEKNLLSVDWSKIGHINAPVSKPAKPVSTEKRDALAALQAEIEQQPKSIPPAITKMKERYNGSAAIPNPLLTKLEEWYTVENVNGTYQISEKEK